MKKKLLVILMAVVLAAGAAAAVFLIFLNPNQSLGKDKYGSEYYWDWYEKTFGVSTEMVPVTNAYCEINGKYYRLMLMEDRVRFGLLTQEYVDEMRNTKTEPATWCRHELFRKDLGKYVGKSTATGNGLPGGLKVYHYAAFPDSDEILIVKLGDSFGYAFYILDPEGNTMDGTVRYLY